MTFPVDPVDGQEYYTEKYVFTYRDGRWNSRVVNLSDILPTEAEVGRGAFFPPFSAVATLRTTLSCTDTKIEFSTDKVTFSPSITVDIGDSFFAEWSDDILSAAQGSSYTTTVNLNYLDISINENLEVNITSIDKVPDPFTLEAQTNTLSDATVEANTLAMLGSINAPTYIWGSSDSSNAQINIADTGWQAIPSTPGSLIITSKDEIRTRHFTNNGSETITTTTINIGHSDQPDAFETSDFVTTNESIGVQQPQITYPTGGSDLESLWSIPIQTSGYGTVGGAGGMVSARWEIATDIGFASKVLDETINGTITSYNVPTLLLAASTSYFLRVTFTSSLGYSSSSLVVPFATSKRLISYASSGRTWTIPSNLSQYHKVFMINLGTGSNGSGGSRGGNLQAGPGGSGGSQGTIRFSNENLGTNTSYPYSTSGGSLGSLTQSSTQDQDGNTTILDYVISTDSNGNDITVRDVFAGMNITSGNAGDRSFSGQFNGGSGGGGAGGIVFSYDDPDGTFETFGGVPGIPTGAKGGDNTPPPSSGRQNDGSDGGYGFGAGAGGGAGGPEDNDRYGNPGAGGSPGASGLSLIVIV